MSLKSGFLSYIGRDLLGLLFWVHWWGRLVEGIWACGYLAVKTDGFATIALIKRLGRLRNMMERVYIKYDQVLSIPAHLLLEPEPLDDTTLLHHCKVFITRFIGALDRW